VRAGQTFARYTTMAVIVITYSVVVYLIAIGYFSTFMLLILFAGRRAFYAIMVLSKPRPEGPPPGFEAFWPTWFSGFAFYHNRAFGGLFILGILLDTLARVFGGQLPLAINWLGAIALGIGVVIAAYRYVQDKAKAKQKEAVK
jgi:hypothetical protein